MGWGPSPGLHVVKDGLVALGDDVGRLHGLDEVFGIIAVDGRPLLLLQSGSGIPACLRPASSAC